MKLREIFQVQEKLSDVPGFGWLKGPDNAAKEQKIKNAAKQFANRKDTVSKERAAELDAALAAFGRDDTTPGRVKNKDLDQALDSKDRKFNDRMDKMSGKKM
jgi:GTP-binding protein EngB required for normal cell division